MEKRMAEIRLDVPRSLVDSINADLHAIVGREPAAPELSANDIAREALAVYQWAVEQTQAGRAVVSVNSERAIRQQIATPHLPPKAPTKR